MLWRTKSLVASLLSKLEIPYLYKINFSHMDIKKTDKEVIFTLPADTDTITLQRILNYLKYKEAIKNSKGTEKQANELARESKGRWWKENKARFIK